MRRALRLLRPFPLLLTLAVLLVAAPIATALALGHHRVPQGRLQVLRLRDPGSGVMHSVIVYRPAGVKDSSRLPVLYFLHGLPGHASDVFSAGLARSLDARFAAGGRPFVVVAPDGNGTRADTEWADSVGSGDRLESFVVGVVVPAVEGAHPRDRAHRAIAGFSMGGYGAVNLAEHHPDLFGQVVSLAGYFRIDDPAGVFAAQPVALSWNSPDQQAARLARTRILLEDVDDESVGVVEGESARLHALLARAGVPSQLEIVPGRHDWSFVASQFGRVESFLESGFAA